MKRTLCAVVIPALAAALVAQAAVPVAEAQPKPARSKTDPQAAARTRGEEGLRLFQAQSWSEAFEAFREADSIYHANTLVLFMGHCKRNMGKLLEARELYAKVANEAVPKGALEQFKKAQATASDELAALQTRIPKVKIVVTGAGADRATATLDGKPASVEELSGGKEIDPGDHVLVIDAPGSQTEDRSFAVSEGGETKVDVALVALKAPPPVDKRGSAVPGGILLGIGVAGIGVGAATGIIAMSQIDDIKSRCRPDMHCLQSDKAKADSAQTLVTVSTIGFIAGGAGLAAGAVLLVLRPGGGSASTSTEASVRLNIGLGSIGVGGSF